MSLNIFAVADVSERKSPAYRAMAGPLLELEREIAERDREARITRNEQRESLREQLKVARKPPRKGQGDREASIGEAAQTHMQLEELGPDELEPRLVMDNTTPEELVTRMAHNGGRIAVMSPEGGFLHVMAGAYSHNSEPADMSALLSAYSGDPIKVDRKGRPPEGIPHPATSLTLVGQPAMLAELCGIKGAQDRGLVSRFVVVQVPSRWPRSLRNEGAVAPERTEEYQAWVDLLRELSRREVSDTPPVLRLSPEAENYLERWHDYELEPERGPEGGRWSLIRGFAGKAHGLAVRFAGLFHLCDHPEAGGGDLIDRDTIEAGCRLVNWALEAHKAAVVGLSVSEEVKLAHRLMGAAQRGTLSKSREAKGRGPRSLPGTSCGACPTGQNRWTPGGPRRSGRPSRLTWG